MLMICAVLMLCMYIYVTQYGKTSLMWAAFNCHEEIMKFLLVAGADINHQDKVSSYSDEII